MINTQTLRSNRGIGGTIKHPPCYMVLTKTLNLIYIKTKISPINGQAGRLAWDKPFLKDHGAVPTKWPI